MDAVDIVWALALCARECDACGCSEPWVIGNDWGGGRGHVTSSAQGDEERTGTEWLSRHIGRKGVGLLDCPVNLGGGGTVKPLFGKQEGGGVGYNPHKPGRPSHAYHSYQVSGLRLMLGVDVLAGNHSHANHTLPGLLQILDGLASHKRPKLVRGDAGLAGEPMFCALEGRGQRYLFKLRLTHNVKRYIEKLFWEQGWNKAGQGWEGKAESLNSKVGVAGA